MNEQYPHIVMIGSQGSGKGTQAQRLVERHGYANIATGQILREHVAMNDILGRQIAGFLKDGELVPDVIVEEVVRNQLYQIPATQPIVFDGFPRKINQAHILEKLFTVLERPQPLAVYLHVSREVVIQRLAHRYVCALCGKILQFIGQALHRCPFCGGGVETRIDDRPEVIETRLNLFFEQTLPLIHYYQRQDQLVQIDAAPPIDEVTMHIEKALGLA